MPVEDGADSPGGIVPASRPIVVVQYGVERQSQIPIRRLSNVGQLPLRPAGVEHFAEDLDAGAVAEKLARRKHDRATVRMPYC